MTFSARRNASARDDPISSRGFFTPDFAKVSI